MKDFHRLVIAALMFIAAAVLCCPRLRGQETTETSRKQEKHHFKRVKVAPELMQIYANYNFLYFGGKLPRLVPVFWGELKVNGSPDWEVVVKDPGTGDVKSILIDRHLKRGGLDYAQLLLLHAMNHVSTDIQDDDDPKFQAGMRRLAKAGAMDGLW